MRNVLIKTAQPFDQESINAIKERFQTLVHEPLRCRVEVDPDLVGGFIAFVGGTVYDFSFKTQLDALRSEHGRGGNGRLHRI